MLVRLCFDVNFRFWVWDEDMLALGYFLDMFIETRRSSVLMKLAEHGHFLPQEEP